MLLIFFDLMALLIGSFWVRNSFLPMSTSFLTNDYPALPDHYISLSHYITVSHYISLSLTVYHCLSLSQTVPPYSSAISTLTSDWLLPHPSSHISGAPGDMFPPRRPPADWHTSTGLLPPPRPLHIRPAGRLSHYWHRSGDRFGKSPDMKMKLIGEKIATINKPILVKDKCFSFWFINSAQLINQKKNILKI